MPPISRSSSSDSNASETYYLDRPIQRSTAVNHHRLVRPRPPPPPQLVMCPMDTVRRIFAEPFAPGSLVPLSPPPQKRFARKPIPCSPTRRERELRDSSRIKGYTCSIEIPHFVKRTLGDMEDDEQDMSLLFSPPPRLDVLVPSPTLFSFSFSDTSSLTSTPALTTASLASTPSSATFSVFSNSDCENSLGRRRSSNDSDLVRPREEEIIASYFSSDDDDAAAGACEEEDDSTTINIHTPRCSQKPHPSSFENYIPPPLPPPKDIIPSSHFLPLCTSPTRSSFPNILHVIDTDRPPCPKRRRRLGRIMSIEEMHVVGQNVLLAENRPSWL